MITVARLTVAPDAAEPVSVDALMAFGRITDNDERPVVAAVIAAAREETERLTGRILLPGTFAVETDKPVSRVTFPIAPVVAVDGIAWVEIDQPLPVPAPALLRLEVAAGYPTPEAIPEGIRHFVQTLALLRYAHRDDPAALEAAQAFAATGVAAFGVVQV